MKQPSQHVNTHRFVEFFKGKNYDLDQQELAAFYRLRTALSTPYESSIGRQRFKYLYELYFRRPCPPGVSSHDWLKLGFQREKPETDLRGAGVMGLQLIIRFVETERKVVQSMSQPQNDFFFAISAINVAFWLKKYLHLSNGQQTDNKDKPCSRRTLKNFGRMLVTNPHSFQQLHRVLLVYLYVKIWMTMKYQGKIVPLTYFNVAFEELKTRLHEIMGQEVWSWEHFEALWLYSP